MSQARGDQVAAAWEYNGAQLEVIRRSNGGLAAYGREWFYCGYVTFEEDPFPGKDYDDSPLNGVEVHGGITFKEGATYGFDCAHAFDFGGESNATNLQYVEAETERLCNQLLELAAVAV